MKDEINKISFFESIMMMCLRAFKQLICSHRVNKRYKFDGKTKCYDCDKIIYK